MGIAVNDVDQVPLDRNDLVFEVGAREGMVRANRDRIVRKHPGNEQKPQFRVHGVFFPAPPL